MATPANPGAFVARARRVKASCGALSVSTSDPPPSPCRAPDPPHRTKRNYEGVSYTGCQTVAGYNAWCYIDAGTCTAGATSHSPGWDYCTDTLSQWCPDGWTYNSFSTYGDGG